MDLFNKKTKRNNSRLNINITNEMIIIYKIKDENSDSEDSQDEDKYEIKLFGEKFIKK